jgi:mannosyltransferase OCH1-like enzyme
MQSFCPQEIQEKLQHHRDFFSFFNIQVKVWTEREIVDLISTKYSMYLSRYIKILNTIQRCDIARAFILHSEGGVYMDVDYRPLVKFRDFFNDNLLWGSKKVIVGDNDLMGVNNAWIYSSAGHGFWNVYLHKAFREIESPRLSNIFLSLLFPTWEIISSTGPAVYNELRQNLEVEPRVFNEWGIHGENSTPTWFNKSTCTQKTLLVSMLVLGSVGFFISQLWGKATPSYFSFDD